MCCRQTHEEWRESRKAYLRSLEEPGYAPPTCEPYDDTPPEVYKLRELEEKEALWTSTCG